MTVVAGNDYLVRLDVLNTTRVFGKHHNAGVNGYLVFHTCTDDRRVGGHKRNCLLLHVRAHQSTGVIVVFKERDHRRCGGNHHLGRNIHEINAVA